MWHSLPAAAICGMIAFLVISNEDIGIRFFKTSAVVLGFLSHLVLDEVWSVDFKKGSYRFKSSFGTALKLWGNNRLANGIAYSMLLVIGVLVYQDQGFMAKYHVNPHVPHTLAELYSTIRSKVENSTHRTGIENQLIEIGEQTAQFGNDPKVPMGSQPPNNWQEFPNPQIPTNARPSTPQPGWQ
jgi:hypothetical protein